VLEAIRESRLTTFQPLLLGTAGFPLHHLTRDANEAPKSEEMANGPTIGPLGKIKKWLWH
jgi:hypothetical protein